MAQPSQQPVPKYSSPGSIEEPPRYTADAGLSDNASAARKLGSHLRRIAVATIETEEPGAKLAVTISISAHPATTGDAAAQSK
jgi:hypothetical protein